MSEEKALHAPATTRNRDPILAVLRQVLPQEGLLLEIAAGTGEPRPTSRFPTCWQASDRTPARVPSLLMQRALRFPICFPLLISIWSRLIGIRPSGNTRRHPRH